MMKKLIPALLLGVALAACSRSEPEAPPEENAVATPVAVSTPQPPVPLPTPSATASPVADAANVPPPPAAIAADEQMIDDASATGMTARVRRDEDMPAEPPTENAGEP